MSGSNPERGSIDEGQSMPKKSRKTVTRRLETGQSVAMTPQDDRMIRLCYDYIKGFTKRKSLQEQMEKKKLEVSVAAAAISQVISSIDIRNDYHDDDDSQNGKGYGSATNTGINVDEERPEATEEDLKLQLYRRLKDDLTVLEDQFDVHLSTDQKITIKDLDAVLKRQYGVTMTKKHLEVCL
jgi:hypothetical protein